MLASTFRCVISTPLGSAVAPDVKMISTRSSRVAGVGANVVASTDGTSSVSKSRSGQLATPSTRAEASTSSPVSDDASLDDAPHPGQELARGTVVHGDDDHAPQHAAPERDDPLGAVLAPHDDPVAFREPLRARVAARTPARPRRRARSCNASCDTHRRRPGTRRATRRGRRRSPGGCRAASWGLSLKISSAISHQPSAFSHQPSAISYGLQPAAREFERAVVAPRQRTTPNAERPNAERPKAVGCRLSERYHRQHTRSRASGAARGMRLVAPAPPGNDPPWPRRCRPPSP